MQPYFLFTGRHDRLLLPECIPSFNGLGSGFSLQRIIVVRSRLPGCPFPFLRSTFRGTYFYRDISDSSRVYPGLPFYQFSI